MISIGLIKVVIVFAHRLSPSRWVCTVQVQYIRSVLPAPSVGDRLSVNALDPLSGAWHFAYVLSGLNLSRQKTDNPSKITICKKEGRKTHYDWLNRVSIIVGKLGSALSELSELSECPNRAECPKRGRVVRICPIVRACPTDFWGFVRPKAEPRPFCPSRARLSELSNVRMPTPGLQRVHTSRKKSAAENALDNVNDQEDIFEETAENEFCDLCDNCSNCTSRHLPQYKTNKYKKNPQNW